MKKVFASLLVLVLLISCSVPAFAAGKLRVEQENFHVVDGYSLYGYGYAKVANVGDKPIKVNTGLLEIYDADGNALTSTDYFSEYAEYLQPGEYTYLKIYDEVENAEASDVDDYMLTITGKADNSYTSVRFPCTTEYQPNVKDGYWNYNYMYGTFTNNTDETVYNITVVLALLDTEGNIIYMDDSSMYSEKGVLPGSSIAVRLNVDSSFIEYFEKNSIVPASVDAIAYVNVSND